LGRSSATILNQGNPLSLTIVTLSDRPDLLATVATWVYEQWWSHLPEHSAATLANMLSERRTSDQIYESFVALLDSVPVGTATVLDHDVDTERRPDLTPWVAAVYVIPEARRQGIGEKLVSQATAFAQSKGFNTVYLWTTDRRNWYERLGWQLLEQFDSNSALVSFLKFERAA
jgi:GNAT superfamily N-acetyltransferase